VHGHPTGIGSRGLAAGLAVDAEGRPAPAAALPGALAAVWRVGLPMPSQRLLECDN